MIAVKSYLPIKLLPTYTDEKNEWLFEEIKKTGSEYDIFLCSLGFFLSEK